ncbi:MAG: cell division protein CrgA [Pseudonocardia sp.]
MPKSKVRKKAPYTAPRTAGGGTAASPAKVAGPSHPVYVAVMLGLMLAGLLWLVVNYLAGDKIGFMVQLGVWNFAIGFVLIVVGLFMTMRWR